MHILTHIYYRIVEKCYPIDTVFYRSRVYFSRWHISLTIRVHPYSVFYSECNIRLLGFILYDIRFIEIVNYFLLRCAHFEPFSFWIISKKITCIKDKLLVLFQTHSCFLSTSLGRILTERSFK